MEKYSVICKNLRKNLKVIIKQKRLSYGQISEMSEVPKTTVYRFLIDKNVEVNIKNVLKLSKFYGYWSRDEKVIQRPSSSIGTNRASIRGENIGMAG